MFEHHSRWARRSQSQLVREPALRDSAHDIRVLRDERERRREQDQRPEKGVQELVTSGRRSEAVAPPECLLADAVQSGDDSVAGEGEQLVLAELAEQGQSSQAARAHQQVQCAIETSDQVEYVQAQVYSQAQLEPLGVHDVRWLGVAVVEL